MKKNDIDPAVMDFLMAREVCRRLGFTPDEIFMAIYPSGQVVHEGQVVHLEKPLIVLEIRRGALEFKWTLDTTELPPERIEAEYERAAIAWNSGALDVSQGDFLASEPARQSMQLMVALQNKGFELRPPQPPPNQRN